MRNLSSCSGPWSGMWIQGPVRGTMTLRVRMYGNRFQGQGFDVSGPFTMAGEYDPETHVVWISKEYPWLQVHYLGQWDGRMIWGEWEIPDYDQGPFELWPLDEEISVRDLIEPLALPEVQAPALPARS